MPDISPKHNLDVLIEDELNEWKKEGLDPSALGVNIWAAHNEIVALAELLIEKGLVDVDELNVKNRQITLRELQHVRRQIGPAVRQARILEGVQLKESPLQ